MNKGVFRRSRKELFAKIVKVLKIFINFFRRKLLPGWLTVFWIRFWLFEKMKANCSHFETIFIHDLYEKVAILEHFHCMKSVQIRCFFLVRIFSQSDWIQRDMYFSVFSPNARKYGPEITTYFDTFYAVFRVAFPTTQKQSWCVLEI